LGFTSSTQPTGWLKILIETVKEPHRMVSDKKTTL
jgi:hypothetical protein